MTNVDIDLTKGTYTIVSNHKDMQHWIDILNRDSLEKVTIHLQDQDTEELAKSLAKILARYQFSG